ncbi:aminotransferase class V-fold PLP-dependent enzyme [Novosphingobium sp. 1949]|uniref:Aminotransferase class V-fold PLP-dependent enzyme n=1 Tax=Novosphingobium organovorum TaxID=2930092 RepID=A0ABT0B8U2_9SPHN|nr:aminotransferase class V-fold PLP-dependent enzyme [Novosphingobium organovorum]MCJ2181491.1 aminotransferase class V-fold PLP-dependent enzyme [Novosphingobium organovorum]
MPLSRRSLIAASAALPLAPRLEAAPGPSSAAPDDETFWAAIAAQYDVTKEVIQLENGNWGMMAEPVLTAYTAKLRRVNRETSYFARRGLWPELTAIRANVAQRLGVAPEEIAFTRNATEALKALHGGYNRLRPGDGVLYADLDYDSVQAGFDWLAAHSGADVVRIALPEPASHQGLIDAYEAALKAHPRVRLMLLTHLSHRTGLVQPVREIAAMARARGVDVILDAAHSWGQIPLSLPELGVDFAGFNLHKWIGAPLGVGLVYIRKGCEGAIDTDMDNPLPGPGETAPAGAAARVHTGTLDYAAQLSVPDAFAFLDRVGPQALRSARLAHLRNAWAEDLRDLPGLEVLTPPDPRLHGGITAFRIAGCTSAADNTRIARRLLEEHRVFTVMRDGVAGGACVRVSPALFTSARDVAALGTALRALAPELRRG